MRRRCVWGIIYRMEPCTCYEALINCADKKTNIIFYGHKISVEDFIRDVEGLAASFREMGLKRGDTVTVYLPSCPQGVAAFYACCKKILKEGGVVALIWNMRDRDEAEQALYALDLKYCAHNFKGRSGGIFNGDNSSLREFFKGGYSEMRFENGAFSYTEEEFVGRRLTSSYALKEGDEKYGEYVDALKEHFKKFSAFGKYVEHIQTHLYYGRI